MFTLALALGVQSSIIPLGGLVSQINGIPVGGAGVLSPLGLPLGGSIVVGPHPAAIPAAISLSVSPAIPPVIAAPSVVAAPAIAGAASYVAKTRGAVHSAPLAGHIQSVANVNVAPAPGTH